MVNLSELFGAHFRLNPGTDSEYEDRINRAKVFFSQFRYSYINFIG